MSTIKNRSIELDAVKIQGSTKHYLELLSQEYSLSNDELITEGLRLIEIDLASFKALKRAIHQVDNNEN